MLVCMTKLILKLFLHLIYCFQPALVYVVLQQPANFDYVRLFGEEELESLSLSIFLSTVGSLKFRGTSLLFRLPQSAMCNLEQQRSK
jgi:hypothetical protein